MRRGTNPTHIIKTNIDLTDIDTLYVTYMQNKKIVIEKDRYMVKLTEDKKGIIINLTQEETLRFKAKSLSRFAYMTGEVDNLVYVQVRGINRAGKSWASNIITLEVEDTLKEGVI